VSGPSACRASLTRMAALWPTRRSIGVASMSPEGRASRFHCDPVHGRNRRNPATQMCRGERPLSTHLGRSPQLSQLVSCPLAADTRPECVSLKMSLSSGRLHLLSLVRSTRALQDCSDRVLAEPDMATDQPVAHPGDRPAGDRRVRSFEPTVLEHPQRAVAAAGRCFRFGGMRR